MEAVGINLEKEKKGAFGRPLKEEAPKKSKKTLAIYDADTEGGEMVIYELTDKSRYKQILACESEIFNGKKREVIRYIPGFSSIHEVDQIEEGGKDVKKTAVAFDITFLNGVLRVNKNNPILIEFLDAHDSNEDNHNRISKKMPVFRKYDVAKKELLDLDNSKDRFKAMSYAMECDTDELYAKAWSMGIDIKRSEDRVRSSFVLLAESDYKKFNKLRKDNTSEANYCVYLGLQKDIIELRNGAIYWAKSPESAPVVLIPPGADPVSHAGRWAAADERGKVFLNLLSELLEA